MDFIKKFFLASQKISQQKLHLKLKTTLFTTSAAIIFFSTLIGIVYFLGFNVLRDKGIESQEEMAQTLASAVDSTIERQAELLKLNANSQLVIDTLKENNLKYRTKSEKETQRYLMDMDKRWIEAPDDHPVLKDYLENALSLKLKELKGQDEKLVNVMITDRFGGLVASTSRPSGFYSFNQDWWLSSYAKGRGKIFITNPEYDEASNLWCLGFALPVEDETGGVIGIYKAQVTLDAFFKPLVNFKIGKTGNAVLVDDKAYLLYHNNTLPFANKFCEYSEFQKTLRNVERWGELDSAYLNQGKTLVAYSQVTPSRPQAYFYASLSDNYGNNLLPVKGMNWYVFVERNLREIFAPLNKLIFFMVLIGIALTTVLALSVFILSGQESPTMLQVIQDGQAQADKAEGANLNRIEKRAKRLPKEKEQ